MITRQSARRALRMFIRAVDSATVKHERTAEVNYRDKGLMKDIDTTLIKNISTASVKHAPIASMKHR
jgi:hypothetical protein